MFTLTLNRTPGNKPTLNHQVYSSNETLRAFARLTGIYTTLAPYHKEVARQVATERLPAMRPLFLHYPDDEATFDIQYEYMYGEHLLVAPVFERETVSGFVFFRS